MRRRSTGARGFHAGELEIRLRKGQVRRLDIRSHDFEIRCDSGSLWITRPAAEGEASEDVVLAAGQNLRPGRVQSLIVEALQDARIQLSASCMEVVA